MSCTVLENVVLQQHIVTAHRGQENTTRQTRGVIICYSCSLGARDDSVKREPQASDHPAPNCSAAEVRCPHAETIQLDYGDGLQTTEYDIVKAHQGRSSFVAFRGPQCLHNPPI